MKIYTRKGDGGDTGLFGGRRRPKDDPRVEAYGSVDELNAVIGVALGHIRSDETSARLAQVQGDLFAIGSHLATPPPDEGRRAPRLPELPGDRVEQMERWIDDGDEVLPPLKNFVLPSGSGGAAMLHMARTVCRRAERRVVTVASRSQVDPLIVRYLNRLSDYLFTAARLENHAFGEGDVEWGGGR